MRAAVIGAGFAGCEAAWQLNKAGIETNLYEMKPKKFSAAHKSENFCELVCSNSLKAERLNSAAGLLKAEMQKLGSLCVEAAYKTKVPAGGALAVDRDEFSKLVTEKIKSCEYVHIINEEVLRLPPADVVIIAAGPLASEGLSETIQDLCGNELSFFDAAAPIVSADSIDMKLAFTQSRYDRGGEDDYINCPMDKAQYEEFYEAVMSAESADLHSFDKKKDVYEGCMPIEVLASRGKDTMRYGPLKPVGLVNPETGHRPWANLQLRKENTGGTMYNLVRFQTNLKFGEQKRVFSMFPALHNAEFLRYGVMHRNTFINSPKLLSSAFNLRNDKKIFFAGQITGVEGYMESAASGIMAGINAARMLNNKDMLVLPNTTMIGALSRYISNGTVENFQPMGANFGVLPPLSEKIRDKSERYMAYADRGMNDLNKELEESK